MAFQWIASALLFLIAIIFIAYVIFIQKISFILFGILLFFAASFALFATTPFCRLAGMYQYYSPLLLSYTPEKNVLDLHLGTSFDFIQEFRWSDRGEKARRHVMASIFEGLLAILEKVEAGEIPGDAKIQATSYFFNERTIEKLGFSLKKVDMGTRINFAMLIVEIAACKSFVEGRPSVPNVARLRKAETTAAELLANKARVASLAKRLAAPKE